MKKIYGAVKYGVLLLIAGILLYLSFRQVKWSDFLEGLKSCNFWWIAASMVLGAVSVLIRSERWRLIMIPLEEPGKKVKALTAWDALNIAYLTNFAIPRAGEITRCGVVSRKSGLSFEKVVGTVVLERSFDMICLIAVTFSLFVISWKQFGVFINNQILVPLGNLLPYNAAINLLILSLILIFAFAIFAFVVYRFQERHQFLKKLANIAKGLLAGLVSGVKMPQKWLFLIYTLLLWISYWLMSWTTILSFPSASGLGPADALFLMVVGSFGWVVPVQGGIGAYHLIVTMALTAVYSISQTTGLIFATISHESQAIIMLLLGVASLVSVSGKKRGLFFNSKR